MMLEDLPGSEWILPGLTDLQQGRTDTPGALLVSIAASRLRGLGLEVPEEGVVLDAELRLYALLQTEHEDPYGQYQGLLGRLVSFCQALEQRRWRQHEPTGFSP